MLLSFRHLGSFLGAQSLLRNGSVSLRQVRFPQPKKTHVLNFVRAKCLLQFPEEDLQKRNDSDHDEIWENDLAWKRKDLFMDGEIDSPERGLWRLTNLGVEKIGRQKAKWLKLESVDERKKVLAGLEYWTEDMLLWMLRIARNESLSLKTQPKSTLVEN